MRNAALFQLIATFEELLKSSIIGEDLVSKENIAVVPPKLWSHLKDVQNSFLSSYFALIRSQMNSLYFAKWSGEINNKNPDGSDTSLSQTPNEFKNFLATIQQNHLAHFAGNSNAARNTLSLLIGDFAKNFMKSLLQKIVSGRNANFSSAEDLKSTPAKRISTGNDMVAFDRALMLFCGLAVQGQPENIQTATVGNEHAVFRSVASALISGNRSPPELSGLIASLDGVDGCWAQLPGWLNAVV